jgi:transcriptional regulator with XRE-family HTH domain
MTAAPGESPAVARRRVRLALRKAREATSLSQSDVAQHLGWSMSKVQRIEAGEVTVSGTDLRALADLYGGFPAEELAQLVEDARIARRQRWWTAPAYRAHLTDGLRQLLDFEAGAAAIRAYQPVLIPGVLQTPAYADFVLASWNDELSDDDRRVRHDVRMLRRRQMIERADAPDYFVVLDESILARNVGGEEIMAAQLDTLVESARIPSVHIRVVPLVEGGVFGLLGPFALVDMDEEDPGDAVLYRESWTGDAVIHNQREVRKHRGYFERLWKESWSEDVSLRFIGAKAATLRSGLDRQDR